MNKLFRIVSIVSIAALLAIGGVAAQQHNARHVGLCCTLPPPPCPGSPGCPVK